MIAALLLSTALAAPITLEEVRAASRQNLDALKAELEVRRQEANVTLAKSAIFPQLLINARGQGFASGHRRDFGLVQKYDDQGRPVFDSNGRLVVEPGFNNSDGRTGGNLLLSAQISQLLYDGGRWWNQIALSGAQQRAAEGQLEEQRLASEYEAVSRFYALLGAQVTVNVYDNAVKRSESQVDRANSLFQAGRAAKLDAIDAAVNLGNDRINVLRQKQSVTQAQVELLKWLGLPTRDVEAQDPGAFSAEPPPVPAFEVVKSSARAHRPLLVALGEQVTAGEKAVDVAWAPFLPTVSLALAYQRDATTLDPFFTDPSQNNSVSAGLNFSWNVFNGFGNQAQLTQARANLSQAKLTLERAEIDLDGDLRRAVEALKTQGQIAQVAQENLKLSESALKLAEERFTAGAGSTIEVRDAQVKLTQSQLSRLQARLDLELARAALRRVVGADVEENR
ncbi:MAG: TolC family protein [Archangiaceae bacterium]|nr:TolC family protein [Archangiaceae bacterium]